jgi:GDP-L-fucose synthase
MSLSSSKSIFVAGHRGMVGSALVRHLQQSGNRQLILRTRQELDLTNPEAVRGFFETHRIHEVYLAAARVGGIHANNTYPVDFLHENLLIQCNVLRSAQQTGVERLLFLGSSCIYPRLAPQPMSEDCLLGGPLELTNEPYALAKIAGIKLCESYNRQYGTDYRSVMPTNLYGPGDNFHPTASHVVPALLRRFHSAKIQKEPRVTVWGTGTPLREFLHVDDMASACVHVMELSKTVWESQTQPRLSHLNVGSGQECSIRELAELIARTVGFAGHIDFDASQPDGTPRKLLDVKKLNALGWRASISLAKGLQNSYQWFLEHRAGSF